MARSNGLRMLVAPVAIILVLLSIVAGAASRSTPTLPTCRLPRGRQARLGIAGPDICARAKHVGTAQAAADASGLPIPDCWGHSDFLVAPDPSGPIVPVTETFNFGDVQLIAHRAQGALFNPGSNPAVTITNLVVHDTPALGFENDHPGGFVRIRGRVYGSEFRSQVLWQEQGMEYAISSGSTWPVKRLAALADSCTIVQPSPEPRFPTNASFPPNQLTSVDWNRPLPYGTSISSAQAVTGIRGAFIPRLGMPVAVFSESFGSARHASHLIVFVFDVAAMKRVLIYEYPAQTSPSAFAESIASMPSIKGPLGSTGYFKVARIRGGLPTLISVANGGALTTVEWLENGVDVMVAGQSVGEQKLLDLARRA